MERSRLKRSYYYDQDYDALPRAKPRYHHHHGHGGGGGGGGHHRRGSIASRLSKPQEPSPPPPPAATVFYRILCPDEKAGGVIGKSGSIIKAIRQDTGAWINVHPLVDGDDERIIEISDDRGRDGAYSSAQEALRLIHERILESHLPFEGCRGPRDDGDGYGSRGGGAGAVTTRLVVPRTNVGSLLGKGGKIIEQMRVETSAQIRILPRDHNMPRCVAMSEEIVQVIGDGSAVKKAIAIISSRLRESLLRDRSSFRGRLHSPEHFFPPDDDFSHMGNAPFRSALDGPASGARSSAGVDPVRGNAYGSRSRFTFESGASAVADLGQNFGEDLVFRILCPNDKVECVVGESDGIADMLREDIGVDINVTDPLPGSAERIILVSSDEGPDDDMFPAQEALLHIQNRIVDLGPDKDNVITTRLLVPASEVACLEGRDGLLSELKRSTRAKVQILPREELPFCASSAEDELVQIVGDIRAARDALVQITSRLRSYLYRENSFSKESLLPPISTTSRTGETLTVDSSSPNKTSAHEDYVGNDPLVAGFKSTQNTTLVQTKLDTGSELMGREETDALKEVSSRKTLEVVVPEHAVPSLIMRSGSKLAQISEKSGATVTLVEDGPEVSKRVIKISGSPEQAERAQSLLEGFILSTQDDAPVS